MMSHDAEQKSAFFRQSGWLMIAGIVGGLMTFGVHLLSKKVDGSQYSAFGTMLMVTACLPTMPLQMIFAQQTAEALATGRRRQLSGMIRQAWLGTFLIWLVGAAAVALFQGQIVAAWKLNSPAALWVTLPVLLVSLWMPMFTGMMQGKQDFFWMGWSGILGGVLRIGVAALLVIVFSTGAAGMMAGALAGLGFGLLIAVWQTRDLWRDRAEPFDLKATFGQIVPLLFGFGACQFMFTTDTMFAKVYFSGEEMARYVAAGTLSRGVLWLVLPLAAVMFPKLVHSHAKSQATSLFGLVVLGTAALAICGGLGLWLFGPLVVRMIFTSDYVAQTTALLPWYAGAMVPLALANVLVNDLLARKQYRVVPWMVLLAIAYGFTLPWMLTHYPGRLEIVLQTLAAFNLLLFLTCAVFVWGPLARPSQPADAAH